MPYGAQFDDDGRVRFRLWAPAVSHLELCLGEGDDCRYLPMTPEAGGWFSCRTDQACAGSRYRYRLEDGMRVPDPASRYQPAGVHGPSEVVDPLAFDWRDETWRGRAWEEAVIYELHVGAFTPEGTFAALLARLGHLAALGITAIELMPVAECPGRRNWGYDGVQLYAPYSRYGTPEDLKRLVQAAHAHGLMVLLDVVYNHFGPEGNYLHRYAPDFFSPDHRTPWGDGLRFDGPSCRPVRDFFIHNALYWLEEYHLDGLRLDAVHAVRDASQPDILEELAAAVARGPGRRRRIHLVLENDDNAARYLARGANEASRYRAQWNDDWHHACHVLLTGETHGCYQDYGDDPLRHLARCLCEGFAYQGEASAYRDRRLRGEDSAQLPPAAFVAFLQNHDQVGNRACGERLTRLVPDPPLRALVSLLLLAPSPPLLFMGEEWGSRQPFLFFCDFGDDLADSVKEGRRRGFAGSAAFSDPAVRARIPDPVDTETFGAAVLDWDDLETARGRERLSLYRDLLHTRRNAPVPRGHVAHAEWRRLGERALSVVWRWRDGTVLTLIANLGDVPVTGEPRPAGRCLHATHTELAEATDSLPAWGLAWYLHADRR